MLTMLLYVLLRCVDFIDDFRDDFSTVFQICVVVVVRERVTVRNPKIDLLDEGVCKVYDLYWLNSIAKHSMIVLVVA